MEIILVVRVISFDRILEESLFIDSKIYQISELVYDIFDWNSRKFYPNSWFFAMFRQQDSKTSSVLKIFSVDFKNLCAWNS